MILPILGLWLAALILSWFIWDEWVWLDSNHNWEAEADRLLVVDVMASQRARKARLAWEGMQHTDSKLNDLLVARRGLRRVAERSVERISQMRLAEKLEGLTQILLLQIREDLECPECNQVVCGCWGEEDVEEFWALQSDGLDYQNDRGHYAVSEAA